VQELRITELLPNPSGTDRGHEWLELCSGARSVVLAGARLVVGARKLALTGTLTPDTCSIVHTGTAALRNREATISLQHNGATQVVETAGTAPENMSFYPEWGGYWASSTPGVMTHSPPVFPPLPLLETPSLFWGLFGTAACVAGILTTLIILVFRHAPPHSQRP
jgi:hypothetical protein